MRVETSRDGRGVALGPGRRRHQDTKSRRTPAIVVPSIPVLSFAASFLLLGEVASARQWLGLLLTAAGILTFVTAPHAAPAPRLQHLSNPSRPRARIK